MVPAFPITTCRDLGGFHYHLHDFFRIALSNQVNGLTERRVVSPNYPLRPGDTVHIAERWF